MVSNESGPAVFVVDDDPSVRKALERLLISVGLTCETFETGVDFLRRAERGITGCVLLDMRMPGLSGIDVQRTLYERGDDLPVIFVTGYADVALAVRAMAGLRHTGAMSVLSAGASSVPSTDPALDGEIAGQGKGLTIQFSDKPVPLPAVEVTDLDGRALSSADWRGKVVLINFWATWCGPCRAEIPEFVKMQERYRDHLVIVGLSVDEGSPDGVKAFVRELGVNYPVAIVDETIQQAFGGIIGLRTTYVVDTRGQIVQRHVGLIKPSVFEHEVRALAGLPTDATVTTVEDTGQVLLSNAAYATEIPGVDLTSLTTAQRETALKRLNTQTCNCGCGLTLAACRINDTACGVSLPLAQQVVKEVAGSKH